MFTDSIDGNIELLRELIAGLPPGARNRAKRAAVEIEKTVLGLKKEHPHDSAVAAGAAFAIFLFAQRLVESPPQDSKERGLIQLLS
jgi:hypothetical protein